MYCVKRVCNMYCLVYRVVPNVCKQIDCTPPPREFCRWSIICCILLSHSDEYCRRVWHVWMTTVSNFHTYTCHSIFMAHVTCAFCRSFVNCGTNKPKSCVIQCMEDWTAVLCAWIFTANSVYFCQIQFFHDVNHKCSHIIAHIITYMNIKLLCWPHINQ